MYKTKVQELCHKRSGTLPDYETIRDGPPHNPRFSCTISVNGLQFQTPFPTRTAKEAQNNAAKLAFDHFTQPINPNPNMNHNLNPAQHPSFYSHLPNPNHVNSPPITLAPQLPSLPGCSFPQPSSISELTPTPQPLISATSVPSSGSPCPSVAAGSASPCPSTVDGSVVLHPKIDEGCQTSHIGSGSVTSTETAGDQKNMLRLYKNQLQNYAQKRNLNLPVYSSEWEGPPHALLFKCRVTIDGQTFESPKFFSTLKDAEHAAAEVALMSLSPGANQEDNIVLYKNLLQELVQKEGFHLPSYATNKYGEAHTPIFVSKVEVGGEFFTGQEAKSKKQAEMSAAKIAYMTLKERKGKSDQSSSIPLSTHQGYTPEFSSDRSKENVETGLQHHANPKSTVSPELVIQNQLDQDKEPAILTKISTNGCEENFSLPDTQPAPPLADCISVASNTSNMPSTEIGPASFRRKVCVYSRNTNMQIEEGGILLPMSDDKWAAYSYSRRDQ